MPVELVVERVGGVGAVEVSLGPSLVFGGVRDMTASCNA
jgi:predicted phage tail protein